MKLRASDIRESVNKIPALPKTINDIMSLLNEDNPKIQEVGKEIMKDQGLTGKVLKMSNSAFYKGRRSIETVTDALVILGLESVESLVIASFAKDFLTEELKGYGYKAQELWLQSFSCAVVAKKIAKETKFSKPEIAYTAGLLKDIGKVILDQYILDYRENILELMSKGELDYLDAEEEILGFNHCQIGAGIAEKWNLSKELIEAIEHQHRPLKASVNVELVSIIHIADLIVLKDQRNKGFKQEFYQFDDETLKLLKLNTGHLDQFSKELEEFLKDKDN